MRLRWSAPGSTRWAAGDGPAIREQGERVNRCAICGKFRPWDALTFRWAVRQTDIYGGFTEDEWFECAPCQGEPDDR